MMVHNLSSVCKAHENNFTPRSPDPSTAKPMTTEYNQKSLNSFWRRGLASLIGGSLLVNCESKKTTRQIRVIDLEQLILE